MREPRKFESIAASPQLLALRAVSEEQAEEFSSALSKVGKNFHQCVRLSPFWLALFTLPASQRLPGHCIYVTKQARSTNAGLQTKSSLI